MSYSRNLCLFTYSGVQHILCCGFALFVPYFASFSGMPILTAPSVFSNVYFKDVYDV
jgi:hypothetical protein